MIIVFPMLTDNTISSNIIPGICSTLERFLIVYKSDAIMKMGGLSPTSTILGVARGAANILVSASLATIAQQLTKQQFSGNLGENKVLEIEDLSNIISEIEHDKNNFVNNKHLLEDFYDFYQMDNEEKPVNKSEKQSNPKDEKIDKNIIDLAKNPDLAVKTGKLDLNTTLSLEPTYITISGKWGTEIIGVKVIPVPIDPKAFVKQLMSDHSGEKTEGFITPIQRKLTRVFQGFMSKFKNNRNLKLNPFDDIIYATSKYGSNVFCLLNLASLSSDNVIKEFGGMERIFKLGWNSVIVSDDLSKRAYFCMKEFGGICSSINYSYIMTSLSDKFEKSFEKLEDLKKSSSIYFRSNMKKPTKIIGESVAQSYIDKFKKIGLPCLNGNCDEE